MGKLEEFEAALVEVLAALDRAQADLARAVKRRAKAELGTVVGDVDLTQARAACRDARARLLQLDREMPVPTANDPTGKPVRRAAPRKPSRQRITIDRLIRALPGLRARDRTVPSWRLIARQSLMLLALVLAYLQYYFLDVQLEVLRLPTVSVLLVG